MNFVEVKDNFVDITGCTKVLRSKEGNTFELAIVYTHDVDRYLYDTELERDKDYENIKHVIEVRQADMIRKEINR